MLGTNLLHLILCYAAYVHSNPLIEHDGHIKFTVPKSYAALGDSYASGLGSGFFTNNSRDGLDVSCLRQDGGYPTQLLKAFPSLQPHGQPFDNVACSGNVLADISGQMKKLAQKKFDLVTLTISGNDFGFDDVTAACVYATKVPDVDAQALCTATFEASMSAVNDAKFWDLLASNITAIKENHVSPNGHLFVTGYGRFFDDPIDSDACDERSFFPIPQLAALNMTAANRRRANQLVDLVNKGIEDTVCKVSENQDKKRLKRSWWKTQHPDASKHERKQIRFINFDKHFEGKRFCEQGNAADPIGSNNPQVFFNDLVTISAVPGKAVGEKVQSAVGGVDIQDKLQQFNAFHPKGALPYRGLVAEVVWMLLTGADDCSEVVKGPAEYCLEVKDHGRYWERDDKDEEKKSGTHHCYDVPAGCALLKSEGTEHMGAPKVVCSHDWSIKDAQRVRWKHEWAW